MDNDKLKVKRVLYLSDIRKMVKYTKYYLQLLKETLKETHKKAQQKVLCDSCVPFNQPDKCQQILCDKYKVKSSNPFTKSKTVSSTYYDTSLGEYVNTKDIDRICKERGLVYGGQESIDVDCKRNKQYNEQKRDIKFKGSGRHGHFFYT